MKYGTSESATLVRGKQDFPRQQVVAQMGGDFTQSSQAIPKFCQNKRENLAYRVYFWETRLEFLPSPRRHGCIRDRPVSILCASLPRRQFRYEQ